MPLYLGLAPHWHNALWFRTTKNRDVSTGSLACSFAHSLAPLTHFPTSKLVGMRFHLWYEHVDFIEFQPIVTSLQHGEEELRFHATEPIFPSFCNRKSLAFQGIDENEARSDESDESASTTQKRDDSRKWDGPLRRCRRQCCRRCCLDQPLFALKNLSLTFSLSFSPISLPSKARRGLCWERLNRPWKYEQKAKTKLS